MTQDREQILQTLLQKLPCQAYQHPGKWWQNSRNSGGLRLSQYATEYLTSLNAPCWEFEIDPVWITPRNMLRMDRLIPVPYSILTSARPRRAWVTVWDSAQAMTIELLGDFDKFLIALERAWAKNTIGKC